MENFTKNFDNSTWYNNKKKKTCSKILTDNFCSCYFACLSLKLISLFRRLHTLKTKNWRVLFPIRSYTLQNTVCLFKLSKWYHGVRVREKLPSEFQSLIYIACEFQSFDKKMHTFVDFLIHFVFSVLLTLKSDILSPLVWKWKNIYV